MTQIRLVAVATIVALTTGFSIAGTPAALSALRVDEGRPTAKLSAVIAVAPSTAAYEALAEAEARRGADRRRLAVFGAMLMTARHLPTVQ